MDFNLKIFFKKLILFNFQKKKKLNKGRWGICMHRLYTTKYIYIISLISTIIIFLLICFFDMQIRNMKGQNLFEPKDFVPSYF